MLPKFVGKTKVFANPGTTDSPRLFYLSSPRIASRRSPMRKKVALLLGLIANSQQKSESSTELTTLGKEDAELIRKHAFIFIGGMPQSGTSFMRHLVKGSSFATGMDSCEKVTR